MDGQSDVSIYSSKRNGAKPKKVRKNHEENDKMYDRSHHGGSYGNSRHTCDSRSKGERETEQNKGNTLNHKQNVKTNHPAESEECAAQGDMEKFQQESSCRKQQGNRNGKEGGKSCHHSQDGKEIPPLQGDGQRHQTAGLYPKNAVKDACTVKNPGPEM